MLLYVILFSGGNYLSTKKHSVITLPQLQHLTECFFFYEPFCKTVTALQTICLQSQVFNF